MINRDSCDCSLVFVQGVQSDALLSYNLGGLYNLKFGETIDSYT